MIQAMLPAIKTIQKICKCMSVIFRTTVYVNKTIQLF